MKDVFKTSSVAALKVMVRAKDASVMWQNAKMGILNR